ncbi:MAG TPA: hypothetical protein VLV15_05170 [Dongiaceae bacterium]|nr:hypothetical protein [Dongiaceae bacterium]
MNSSSVLREGVLVGLAGAAAVAVWFLLYDLATGAPFRTPALLGAVLFEHLREPSALVIRPKLVLQYTVVHGIAFVLFGVAAAGLFALVDRVRAMLFGLFMLFCCFEVAFLAAVTVLSEMLAGAFSPWAVLCANALASIVMLAMLWSHHARSIGRLTAPDDGDAPAR